LGDKVKEDEIVGAWRMHGRGEKFIKIFGRKTLREETARNAKA